MDVNFCCCKMKPHTYFLLINYICSAIFAGMATTIGIDLSVENTALHILILQYILLLVILVTVLIGLAAFFFYVFTDNVHNDYIKFYAGYLFIVSIVGVALAGTLLILNIFRNPGETLHLYLIVTIRWIIAISFLGLLIPWSQKLIEVVNSDRPKEEAGPTELIKQPILADETHIADKKATEVQDKPEVEGAQVGENNA